MRTFFASWVSVFVLCTTAWCGEPLGDTNHVKNQIMKFVPVKIETEKGLLNSEDIKVAGELIKAARYMNEIFLRQVWDGNVKLRNELTRAGKEASPFLEYFTINAGPFDRLDHNRPFINGVPEKPAGAGYYPNDLTKEEFDTWVKKHPKDRSAFESNFTIIKRDGRNLNAMPYSLAYKDFLEPAADHLRNAAAITKNPSLKKYLTSRGEAFLSNDYFQSDVDWVNLKDHRIEVVIGPYEVYEDELLGYKAAFEAFITLVDSKESARLAKVASFLPDLQKNLPVEEELKGIGRNLSSPIIVAQVLYTAGDANRGVQTIAFNLPNDERVRKEYGSKKVMLKNIQHAKFSKILKPIANALMAPDDASKVDFEAFFAHTLLHEISHGIGPGEIKKDGRSTTVNKELKELYSVIEECKADTLGIYNNSYLIDKGLYASQFRDVLWPTYLAGIFRATRFGINEAHGGGNAIQLNYLMEKGGIVFDKASGKFKIIPEQIDEAIRSLAAELLTIEGRGDYKAAKAFVLKYRMLAPELKLAQEKLKSVPVDIRPIYKEM